MIPRELDKIDIADIQALVQNGVPEGRSIEYKAKLPGPTDDDKREFLNDVSSFANGAGGDIVYGITAQRDAAGKTTGLPEDAVGLSGVNADTELSRLSDLLRTSIDPKIPGVQLRFIDGFTYGPVLVARIPQSWAAPHMVTFRNLSRFFSRGANGKYQLDVREIRAAFALSDSLPQRVRSFRDDRLAKIIAGQTPAELAGKKRLVWHILPVAAFDRPLPIALSADRLQQLVTPAIVGIGGTHVKDHRRFNLDGFVIHEEKIDPDTRHRYCMGYVQVFRTGAIEVAATIDLPGGLKDWLPEHLGAKLGDYFTHYIEIARSLGITPPVFVFMTLLNVKGTSLYLHPDRLPTLIRARGNNQPFDRETLLLPDILVEDLSLPPSEMLRPALDALWQAGGWPEYFDDRNT